MKLRDGLAVASLLFAAVAVPVALFTPEPTEAGPVPCPSLLRLPAGLCTHGNDPRSLGSPEAGEGASGLPCDGDGVSGPRVQVIVARPPGAPDRSQDALSQVNTWAAQVDAAFDDSAAQTGGHRRVRWVTNSDCTIHTENLILDAGSFDDTIRALQASGHTRTDRKYLVWMDASVYCGIATIEGDDQPGTYNASNYRTGYARVDRGCWNAAVATHELGHNLGAVQLSAPHSDGSWHGLQEYDRMDYGGQQVYDCPDPSFERLLDCQHDDYFSTSPSPGSYLDTRWNVARSVFLVGGAVAPPSPTPTPRKTCKARVLNLCL